MTFIFAPIVEGHGDVAAVPKLICRIAPSGTFRVAPPVRRPKTALLQPSELARAVHIARANIRASGMVLIVLDADEDCAATLGPKLLANVPDLRPVTSFVALAVREFESWIVAGMSELEVDMPDKTGRMKDRLRAEFGRYKETVDQPRLTGQMDIDRAVSLSPSFRRLALAVRTAIPSS